MTLVENDFIISSGSDLNNYFRSVIKEVDIKATEDLEFGVSNTENVADRAIEKSKNHSCIEKIKETFVDKNLFSFNVSLYCIFKEIVSQDSHGTTDANLFAVYPSKACSECVISRTFPSVLELAVIAAIIKKKCLIKPTRDQLVWHQT